MAAWFHKAVKLSGVVGMCLYRVQTTRSGVVSILTGHSHHGYIDPTAVRRSKIK